MKPLVPLLFLASLALCGCSGGGGSRVPDEPMGPDAPEFGSTAQYSTVAGFLEGRWSPVINSMGAEIDPQFAKQLGIDSLGDPNEVEVVVGRFWQFAPDGTFYYSEAEVPWKIHGHWTAAGKGVRLAYETYNDKTIAEAKANLHTAAETGQAGAIAGEIKMDNLFQELEAKMYFEVHADKKRLEFKAENARPGSIEALMGGGGTLMRLGFAKE